MNVAERDRLLVHRDVAVGAMERVPGGVLPALGETGEQEPRRRCRIDLDAWRNAQACNAAHKPQSTVVPPDPNVGVR